VDMSINNCTLLELFCCSVSQRLPHRGRLCPRPHQGEYNTDTGVWQPKAYTGSYGAQGWFLNFSDNSDVTAATLGADSSGNGNNWTPNNFSVTAGAGNDSLVDTPTPTERIQVSVVRCGGITLR
jgi:hypothetical protein